MKSVTVFPLAVLCAAIAAIPLWSQVSRESPASSQPVVMFWNLENFYDYIDQGTGSSDAEFSSRGARHWTKARFYTKCDAIAKMIMWVGDRYGSLPAVVGFAEVENAWVMRQLIRNTALMKYGYRLVHYESPDSRGIDVALIYREEIFELIDSKPCHIYQDGTLSGENLNGSAVEDGRNTGLGNDAAISGGNDGGESGAAVAGGRIMSTRDILLVTLRDRRSGEVTRFLVNHHPSKYGGEAVSRPKRLAAMTRLSFLCDSIMALDTLPAWQSGAGKNSPDEDAARQSWVGESGHGGEFDEERSASVRVPPTRIIAMGDFNDTPDNPLFGIFDRTMVNKTLPLYKKGFGTIKYQGKWELIDMFFISASMEGTAETEMKSGKTKGKSSKTDVMASTVKVKSKVMGKGYSDGKEEFGKTAEEDNGKEEFGKTGEESCKAEYVMEIVQAPFHLQRDTAHVGEKPFRTYSGPRYIGGISDHFPIVLLPASVPQK